MQKQARKSRVTRKSPTRVENQDKPISKLHDELRKHSDARKKTEREILDIRKELKMCFSSSRNYQGPPETSSTDA